MTADVAFVGCPSSAEAWGREVALARAAGLRVILAETSASVPARLEARLVVVGSAEAAAGLRDLSPEAVVVLRRVGLAAPELARALAERLDRRVVIAPLDAAERLDLGAALPGRWLTRTDWPPLLREAETAAGVNRPLTGPLRIATPAPESGHDATDLRAALEAAGAPAGAFAIDADPAPHVALGPLDADAATRALEDGTLVLSPESAPADLLTTRTAWPGLVDRLAALIATPTLWRGALFDLAARALPARGEAAFLALLGLRPTELPADLPERAPRRVRADIALIGDLRRPDEVNAQALAQIRAHRASGRRVALVHVTNGRGEDGIHPGFDALARLGLAEVMGPEDVLEVDCAQVLIPRLTLPALGLARPAITARRWLVTETEALTPDWDAGRLHAEVTRLYGVTPAWAASHVLARASLAERLPVPVAAWPVAAPRPSAPAPVSGALRRSVAGVMAWDPADLGTLPALFAENPGVELHVHLAGHRRSLPGTPPANCTVLGLEGQDVASFVNRIDALIVPPGTPYERLPRLAIALARSRGIPVLTSPGEAPLTGGGTSLPMADWATSVLPTAAPPVAAITDADFAGALGLPRVLRPARRLAQSRRVLFVTANGVGLGHVTRLSAIARRLPEDVEPIFATMSQAASVLKDMGYFTELLTGYTGRPADAWRAALRDRIGAILDHHRPSALVLDSSNPYPGVVEALACRPDHALVWVRRGMWRETQDHSEFLSRAPYFDCIIEPQDIAEVNDPAPLAAPHVVRVPPIGLLDETDLLPQREARIALGLSPEPPPGGSVLVQLGSGTTRDLDTLLDEVLARLRAFPGLEIVLAQWLNTASAYDARWPGVRILSGYPIPRYYRAFDFTVSAAGYNSFNDLLRFALPTIFVANDAQCMDDQGARARFAERAEAAFDVQEDDLAPLSDCVAAILQPAVRAHLQDRSRAIALPNGAAAAAAAIMETIG